MAQPAPRLRLPLPQVVLAPGAAERRARALDFIGGLPPDAPVLVLAPSLLAATRLLRELPGPRFGATGSTLPRLALALATPALQQEGRVPAPALALEAVAARVVHGLSERGALGRFAPIADRPGLARALLATTLELRLAGVGASGGDVDAFREAFERELQDAGLADRGHLFARAFERIAGGPHPLLDRPTLLLDVPLPPGHPRALALALLERAPHGLITVAEGDEATLRALPFPVVRPGPARPGSGIARLQAHLFAAEAPSEADASGELLPVCGSSEGREALEVVRLLLAEAERGVPFERMAVVLRSPALHRGPLREALARASVPAWFASGTSHPDPAGRALLALLACADEGLSARRFAEYLSLSELPDAGPAGAPPAAEDAWVPAIGDDGAPDPLASADDEPPLELAEDDEPVTAGTLRAPRRWEQLLLDAAVIGGRERWLRRLAGLREELRLDLATQADPEGPQAAALQRDLAALEDLCAYALPLLDDLLALQAPRTWEAWLPALRALCARALRRPRRVLEVLSGLQPLGPLGPVGLGEVRAVLLPRLSSVVLPRGRPQGAVFVGTIEAARGLDFEVVAVPGLSERLFPQRALEDPVLGDSERLALGLPGTAERTAEERLLLRLAVGAARQRVILSWARSERSGRPRVPSFYALEALRAERGRLPSFGELMEEAARREAARPGWPAPGDPARALDREERDLALIGALGAVPDQKGRLRHLVEESPVLARALRSRARRALPGWTSADGLVRPAGAAREALSAHGPDRRPYSPTALQHLAACPYRFVLHAFHKLAPREEPVAIEEMDPLQFGSLVHDTLFETLSGLRDGGLLPLAADRLEPARAVLDAALARVAARYRDDLAPAIPRVFEDGVAAVRSDALELLRRMAEDPSGFAPWRFELAFGMDVRRTRDPESRREPAALACGIDLRGSIDLVERRGDGTLRVTDYKTGKVRLTRGGYVAGGETLQPVLYALALEALQGETVESGRLWYCTSGAGFEERVVPLDGTARAAADALAAALAGSIETGLLPADPREGACTWCDYRSVCGPHEERRVRRKPRSELKALDHLRDLA